MLRRSRCRLSGDADPAAAAALSLAVDDVVTLADSSVEMLDRAGPTSVAIECKCVFAVVPLLVLRVSHFVRLRWFRDCSAALHSMASAHAHVASLM